MKDTGTEFFKYNLEVNIEGIFSSKEIHQEEWFKASICISDKKIELRLQCNLNPTLSFCIDTLNDSNYSVFGKKIKYRNVLNNVKNYRFDFTISELVQICIVEDSIIFEISSIMWHFPKNVESPNATFLLRDAGLKFAQSHYGLICFNKELTNENHSIEKKSYNILGVRCTPKIIFYSYDGSNTKYAQIEKQPCIVWESYSSIKDLLMYNEWIMLIASLYYQTQINFISAKIELENNVTVIHQRFNKTDKIPERDFPFPILHTDNIEEFVKLIDFHMFNDNYAYVKRAIGHFLQTQYLDGNILFLVLYNIIEICKACDAKKNKKIKRTFSNLSKLNKEYKKCLYSIIESTPIQEGEQEDFITRWHSLWSYLQLKPMKNELLQFLEKKNFNIVQIKSYVSQITKNKYKDLISIRNDITHGGACLNDIDIDMVSLNNLVSLIVVVLILDIMGISEIQIMYEYKYSDILLKKTKNNI